jgi:hypothetical protein
MDWASLTSAILAGGLAGQITTLLLGERFTSRRDFNNWLREERFKVYSELITLVASDTPPVTYDRWPGEIRALCQKVFLLSPNGRPPQSLVDAMEDVFQDAYIKKKNKVKDNVEWIRKMKKDADLLRQELAKVLHDN